MSTSTGWWDDNSVAGTILGATTKPKAITSGKLNPDPDECKFCLARGQWVAGYPDLCSACWMCKECNGDATECQCWETQIREDSSFISEYLRSQEAKFQEEDRHSSAGPTVTQRDESQEGKS